MRRVALPLIAALIAGCTAAPPRTPETSECRNYFEALDLRAAHAGVRDGGTYRVPGFAYLRVDRFLASFRDEVTDDARFQRWVERMRGLDLSARRAELSNLGIADVDTELGQVERCGEKLAQLELSQPAQRAQLAQAARVPDDYYMPGRVFGLYPAALPFLNLGIRGYQKKVEADYARPVAQLEHPGKLVRWDPPAASIPPKKETKTWFAQTDALGVPLLSRERWQRLAEAYAPSWWIEQGGDYDRPGAPKLGSDRPALDANRPTTYFLRSYTRLGGKVLVQLVYVVWFSERPVEKFFDAYAGDLDGVVWRVTLDAEGQPLIYDTIHPCGCYRYYFPVWPLAKKPDGSLWQEPALFPQAAVPQAGRLAIRVQSATHYVRRVVEATTAEAEENHRYLLLPYTALLTLDAGNGRTRSLFGEDGLVEGTERGERFWLWVTGVPDAGAMRQWGRHATSFVGRSHFDDPKFLNGLFEVAE